MIRELGPGNLENCPWSSQSVGPEHHQFGSGVMLSAGAALLAKVSLELKGRKLDGKQGRCRAR